MPRLAANGLLLLAAAIWGGGFIAQARGLAVMGPFWFTCSRFLLAALVVLPWAWLEGRGQRRPLSRAEWRDTFFVSLAFCVGSALQQVALVTTPVTNVGFLTGLYILFVPLVAFAVVGERPHPVLGLAIGLSLAGIWLLAGGVGGLGLGDGLTILSAFCFAWQLFLIGRVARTSGRPALISFVQMTMTTFLSGLAALATERVSLGQLEGAAFDILYAGVFSGGLAFTLQAVGQRYTAATDAALLLSAESLFAALFAALLLDEPLGPPQIAGGLAIFAAIVIVQLGPRLWRKAQPA